LKETFFSKSCMLKATFRKWSSLGRSNRNGAQAFRRSAVEHSHANPVEDELVAAPLNPQAQATPVGVPFPRRTGQFIAIASPRSNGIAA
jgi:hypothetical protein